MRSTHAVAVVVISAALAAGVAASHQAPPRVQDTARAARTAVITGTVLTTDDPARPLRRVTVMLSGAGQARVTSTDDSGRYAFPGLVSGSYTLRFEKGTYISVEYGAPRPGSSDRRSIVLTPGQVFNARPVVMPKGAVIAGRVTDHEGRPIRSVPVEVMQFVTVRGAQTRRTSTFLTEPTNEHGEYRIFGIQPGTYLVAAAWEVPLPPVPTAAELRWADKQTGEPPSPVRRTSFAPTLYPGVSSLAAATPITVAAGEERLDIDISVRTVPTATISGVVTTPDGKPAPGIRVWRTPKHAPWSSYALWAGRTSTDGTFVVTDTAPGEWIFAARTEAGPAPTTVGVGAPAAAPPGERFWAIAEIAVSGQDVKGLSLVLQRPLQLSGRVIVEGKPASMSSVRVQLSRHTAVAEPYSGSLSATPGPDGAFRIENVIPSSYGVIVSAPAGVLAKSALAGGRDLLDQPIELASGAGVPEIVVTLTDRIGRISGGVTDAAGAPVTELSVMVFSTNEAHWTSGSRRIKTARASETGTYLIDALPAGEYYLCAVAEVDRQVMSEVDYLRTLIPASIRITLADGEKKTQDLRAGGLLG